MYTLVVIHSCKQIDYVAHDDLPYESEGHADVYAFVKEAGRFVATQRTTGVSTSELITRIVRDYDAYVRRNLARGVTAKDLNLSYLKFTELQVREFANKIGEKIQQSEKTVERFVPEAWKPTLRFWEERSSEFVRGFGNLFRKQPEMP